MMPDLDKHIAALESLIVALKQLRVKPGEGNPAKSVIFDLLDDPAWPLAVDQDLIVDDSSEEQKMERAATLLEGLIPYPLTDMKFLDFGCGEGHVAVRASDTARISVGYDIVSPKQHEGAETPTAPTIAGRHSLPALVLTDQWYIVEKTKPYDIVFVHDVIDHVVGDTQAGILTKITEVLRPGGKIYMRCHPWCSRHATHLYRQKNKAFIHLVFDESELAMAGLQGLPTVKVIHPIAHYEELFRAAGLTILSKQIHAEPTEKFFIDHPEISRRIKRHWRASHDTLLRSGAFPEFQTSQQFIDYVLTN